MKKILAVLLACSMLFAFAACGGNNEETTTTAAPETTVAEETTAADVTEAPVADETTTEAAADETTTVAGEETTAAAAPATTEEIVAYFNTAINSAKKDSKSIHSNFMKHSVAGEITGIPGWLEFLIPGSPEKFVGGFMGEDKKKANVTWSSAEDKNAFFPVENETWASKLTADDVMRATCTPSADGKTYTIKITTKADDKSENVKHGQGHAPKAFNVVLPATISDNIPGFLSSVGTAAMNYPSSTVVVKVDVATGRVLTANYLLYWTINLPVKDAVVVLPFSTENDYVINW